MAQVRLLGGKPLMVGRKVATSDDCCCTTPSATCILPAGDCRHALCWEANFSSDDVCFSDMVEFFPDPTANNGLGFYFNPGDSTWRVFDFQSFTDQSIISSTVPVKDAWHSFIVYLTRVDDNNVHVEWSVDDISGTAFNFATAFDTNTLNVGSINGDGTNAHRSFRNISVLANPLSFEENFVFPTDSFDSLTGGATIISDVLEISNPTSDSYGTKLFCPTYNLTCKAEGACCKDAVCTLESESDCIATGGTYKGDGSSCCDIDPCTGHGCDCSSTTININVSATGSVFCNSELLNMSGSHSWSLTSTDLGSTCYSTDFNRDNCQSGCSDPTEFGVVYIAYQIICTSPGIWQLQTFAELGCSFPQVGACDPGTDLNSNVFVNTNATHTGLTAGTHTFVDHYTDTAITGPCTAPLRSIDLTSTITIA